MLTPNLYYPLEVLHKLERERYRAYHHRNFIHKSDHFFNFCVTALSLKDYVLHYLDKPSRQERQPFYDIWAEVDCLRTATEIANATKHRVLRTEPSTKGVARSRSKVVNLYVTRDDGTEAVEEEVPDYNITMADERQLHLYEFMDDVIEYWKDFLISIGIEYSAQDGSVFFGEDEI